MINQTTREAVSVIFDEGLLLAIATFLLLKALIFRRITDFGRALSRSNLALAIAYYGTALGMHIGFFRSELWRWGIRAAVLFTTACAVLQMIHALGGWRAAGREARIAFAELAWEIWRLPSICRDHCCAGFTLSRDTWTRASAGCRILYAGIALVVLAALVILAVVFYETRAVEEVRDYGMV